MSTNVMNLSVTCDVDGYVDEHGIKYLGKAHLQSNGKWVALAVINDCLCRVEVNISGNLKPINEEV